MIKTIIKEIKEIKSTRKELRNFGLVVGGVLIGISAFLFWKDRAAWPYLAAPGAALMLLGLLIPSILKPLQKVWMAMAVIMGFFMTRVILTILFFCILTPLGIVAKITGKRFMELKPLKGKTSYWNLRESKKIDKKDYERQF